MRLLISLLFCFLFSQHLVIGQDVEIETNKPFLSLSGVNVITTGPWLPKQINRSIAEMRTGIPESEILQRDFSGLNQIPGVLRDPYRRSLGVPISVLLNFDVNSKNNFFQKFRPEFRFGLSYWRTQIAGSTHEKEQRTIVPNPPGNHFASGTEADSVHIKQLIVMNWARMVAGHASLILKSNPERRFHVYGGLGFEGGLSFRSKHEIDVMETYSIVDMGENPVHGLQNERQYDREDHKARTSAVYSVFLPYGASVRFSRKHGFFSKLNLFVELRSLVYIHGRVDGGSYSFTSWKNPFFGNDFTGGIGLRFTF